MKVPNTPYKKMYAQFLHKRFRSTSRAAPMIITGSRISKKISLLIENSWVLFG